MGTVNEHNSFTSRQRDSFTTPMAQLSIASASGTFQSSTWDKWASLRIKQGLLLHFDPAILTLLIPTTLVYSQ